MENKKISELNSASLPLSGTEFVPIVQGGETKKVNVSELKTAISGSSLVWSYFSSNQVAVTGTVANTIMDAVEIPPEFLEAGFLEVQIFMRRSGSTALTRSLLYFGTDAITLGTIVGKKAISGTGILNKSFDRTIIFNDDILISTSPSLDGFDDNSTPARGDASNNYTVVRDPVFNISSKNFLQIVTLNAGTSETTTLEGFIVKIYN